MIKSEATIDVKPKTMTEWTKLFLEEQWAEAERRQTRAKQMQEAYQTFFNAVSGNNINGGIANTYNDLRTQMGEDTL